MSVVLLCWFIGTGSLRASPPFVNGTGYIDNHLVGFRTHVNQVRSSKCLSRYPYGMSRSQLAGLDLGSPQRRFVRLVWKARHWRTHHAAGRCSPAIDHRWLWECIHRHETSDWHDPNSPYWGGLQMGQWFHDTYGGSLYRTKGYADNWTPAEQMAVAGRAYHQSGHSSAWLNGQWPGTLSECGA